MHSVELFIAAQSSIEEFAAEFGALAGLAFRRRRDTSEVQYIANGADVVCFIRGNTLENDRDMVFESYRFMITILADDQYAPITPSNPAYEFAQFAFDRLKSARGYPLLMTTDVQVKLREYTPDSELA